MKWKASKRWTALILSLLMVFSAVPTDVFGSGEDTGAAVITEEEAAEQAEEEVEEPEAKTPVTEGKTVVLDEGNAEVSEDYVSSNPEQTARILENSKATEAPVTGQTDYTFENDTMTVQLQLAEEDALPEGVQLLVAPIDSYLVDETTSDEVRELKAKFDDITSLLKGVTDSNGNSVQGFEAYHMELISGDTVYIPVHEVTVTVAYKTAALPEVFVNDGANVTEVKNLNYTTAVNEKGKDVTILSDLNDKLTAFQFADTTVGSVANYGFKSTGVTDFVTAWCGTVDEETQKPEIVRFDYKSDEVNVLVTLKNQNDLPENAQLVVEPAQLTNKARESLEEAAIEEQKAIEKVFAYDIRFEVDGEEVQPGNTVNVQVTIPEITAKNDATVYHIDSDSKVENMDGNVDERGNVVFDTTHFSTYVIVQQGGSNVLVHIQHYSASTQKVIYSQDNITLPVGGSVNNYAKAINWDVSKVVKVTGNGEETISDPSRIAVVSESTIRVYYTAKSSTISGQTTFYDYLVKPGSGTSGANASINTNSNYPSGSAKTNRFSVGTTGQNYSANQYSTLVNEKDINTYTSGNAGIKTGIITGLSDDYKRVNFSVDEPGVFSNDTKVGKTILTDYSLMFNKVGDTYTLASVWKGSSQVASAGNGFFPLDNAASNVTDSGYGSTHNYFFGMRYDVTFTLGDYVGPLNYSFTGDDDLWVILDGKTVVVDLGGIHDALSSEVNLWDKLGMQEGIGATTSPEKNKQHTLTILYMDI